mgnify:CR=1 FL=1
MSKQPHEKSRFSCTNSVSPINSDTASICVNAIWLSDVHLGSKNCKAEYLLQFLQQLETESLYLVGDIFDVWALKRRVYWPESHNKVLQQFLKMARDGVKVVYIPGNHDEVLKPYSGFHLWDLSIFNEYIHCGVNGHKLLMLHGDQFDSEICIGRTYAKLGDHLYDLLLFLNSGLHKVRSLLGYPYWSLASYVKLKIGKAQQAINDYQSAVIRYSRTKNVDGVISGHIHQPAIKFDNKILYINDGDWVENCTFVAESRQGDIQLFQWQQTAVLISSHQFPSQETSKKVKRIA